MVVVDQICSLLLQLKIQVQIHWMVSLLFSLCILFSSKLILFALMNVDLLGLFGGPPEPAANEGGGGGMAGMMGGFDNLNFGTTSSPPPPNTTASSGGDMFGDLI